MPRAQANGGVSAHRQDNMRLVHTMRKLCHLAKISDLKKFADAADWSESLDSWATSKHFRQKLMSKASYIQLLDALYTANSNGLQQLVSSWPEPDAANAEVQYPSVLTAAVNTVICLVSMLPTCHKVKWYNEEVAKREAGTAVETGFLHNMGAMMSKLLANLRSLQPVGGSGAASDIQHHTAYPAELDRLAASLFQIWSSLLALWPGPELFVSEVAATLEPATSLAVALLQTCSAAMTFQDSSSSSSNSSSSNRGRQVPSLKASDASVRGSSEYITMMAGISCRVCLCISRHLLAAIASSVECLIVSQSSSADKQHALSRAETVLALPDVQRLLLFGLAAAAAASHKQKSQQAGRALHGKQQHSLQGQGHLHLLAALGMSTSSRIFQSPMTEVEVQMFSAPMLQQCIWTVTSHLYKDPVSLAVDLAGSGGSSSTSPSCPQPESSFRPDQDFLKQMALPVLETMKDLIMVLPDDQAGVLIRSLTACWTVTQWLTYQHESLEQKQQALQWLLQPLYERVCRAAPLLVEQIRMPECADLRAAGAGTPAAAQLEQEAGSLVMQIWQQITILLFKNVAGVYQTGSGLPDQLVSFIRQHPATSLSATETAVRVGACATADSIQCYLGVQEQMPFLSQLYMHSMVGWILRCFSDGSSVVDEILKQPRLQQQLFSLICCRLKLMKLLSAAAVHSEDSQLIAHIFQDFRVHITSIVDEVRVVSQIIKLYIKSAQLGSLESADQQVEQPRHQQQKLMACPGRLFLLGRALCVCAASLPQETVCCLNTADEGSIQEAVAAGLQYLDLLSGDGDDAAAAEVKEQLQVLQQDIAAVQAYSTGCGGDINTAANKQLLLIVQMQQCGSAICAALPVKFCCNNSACVNLAKLSEQQLVAGKGSRCSGCKVARYCSRDCQLKHWKQHKKTCRRVQQAEAAQEGRSRSK